MNWPDFLDVAGDLDDAEFDRHWTALGTVVRIAARTHQRPGDPARAADGKVIAGPPRGSVIETKRDPHSSTSATTERRWSPQTTPPASPFGFTRP